MICKHPIRRRNQDFEIDKMSETVGEGVPVLQKTKCRIRKYLDHGSSMPPFPSSSLDYATITQMIWSQTLESVASTMCPAGSYRKSGYTSDDSRDRRVLVRSRPDAECKWGDELRSEDTRGRV